MIFQDGFLAVSDPDTADLYRGVAEDDDGLHPAGAASAAASATTAAAHGAGCARQAASTFDGCRASSVTPKVIPKDIKIIKEEAPPDMGAGMQGGVTWRRGRRPMGGVIGGVIGGVGGAPPPPKPNETRTRVKAET